MFDRFRGTFQPVQDVIKAGLHFRSPNVEENQARQSKLMKSPVNFDAGAELLNKYQNEWSELHKQCEENAGNAQKLDATIGRLHTCVEKQWDAMSKLTSGLSSVSKLIDKTEEIVNDLGKLQNLILEVENGLVLLTDLKEAQQLQEQFVEGRFQLALHREKKLSQLENVRLTLTEDHRSKLFKHEQILKDKQKEREIIFGEAFAEDLAAYKQTGTVPQLNLKVDQGPSLEEVELDIDREALDDLLNN